MEDVERILNEAQRRLTSATTFSRQTEPFGRRTEVESATLFMGSLRRSSTTQSSKGSTVATPPQVPPPLALDVGLELDAFNCPSATSAGDDPRGSHPYSERSNHRAAGRRSLSHSATSRSSPPSLRSPPRTKVLVAHTR